MMQMHTRSPPLQLEMAVSVDPDTAGASESQALLCASPAGLGVGASAVASTSIAELPPSSQCMCLPSLCTMDSKHVHNACVKDMLHVFKDMQDLFKDMYELLKAVFYLSKLDVLIKIECASRYRK